MSAPPNAETIELLQTLIRNACVNEGTEESGHEVRNSDVLETYHDAMQLREDGITLFSLGQLSLTDRARVERLFFARRPTLAVHDRAVVHKAVQPSWVADEADG